MNVITHTSSGDIQKTTFDSFTFAGGEEHIRFNPKDFLDAKKVVVHARLNNSSMLMKLMMATDAIKRMIDKDVALELVIPYFPYARQDRVCVEGEALGAAVMARFINNLKFDKVTIWDAHSEVSPALINNVVNVSQLEILKQSKALTQLLESGELGLVSPDAGASKKTLKIAEHFNGEPALISAQKLRNLKTGDIIKTDVSGDMKGKNLLIVDDICDGGRTFIELAKVLKAKGAAKISLFVTHGIFSKGIAVFDGLIDTIYTTDSFRAKDEFDTSNNT